MKKVLLALLAFVFITVGCKKDDDDGPPEINRQNVAGNYRLNSIMAQVGAIPAQDVTDEFLEPCEKDDLLRLNANGTYTSQDDGVQCNPPSESSNGTWDVPSPTQFVLDTETYTLVKYDGSVLEVSYSDNINGQQATITLNLRKQ